MSKITLEEDKTERYLGEKMHICRICGAEGNFPSYLAREMMQNKRDEFEYFECPKCRCLQISEIPNNLGDYYGDDYYSFSLKMDEGYEFKKPAKEHNKILDVGCGSGVWLLLLADEGYDNLYGCDPFLNQDIRYGDRVYIRKCSIHDIEGAGTFELISFNDSFEHVSDPLETLQSAKELLGDKGVVTMDIPTYPNIAFDMFGPNWYQLDAPRHLFLHSKSSVEYLAGKAGMKVLKYEYDSNTSQIIRSFFYKNGVPYYEQSRELIDQYFSSEDIESIRKDSEECNRMEHGDHMKVYLAKSI